MGLLDTLGNLSPEQTQGLLGLATNMLAVGGPSLRPTSFGQALGAGLQGFQGGIDAARQRKLEEEQAKQIAEMRGLQIQSLTGELQDKETARQQALAAQDWYQKFNAGHGTPTSVAQSVLGANLAPTTENAAALSAAQQQGGNTMSMFNQRMARAQAMRASGIPQVMAQADAEEKSALAFQPKVKSWEKVSVGGRVLLKPYFEDGTAGDPVPADVAEKLQFQNLGGKTVGLNPFTGQQLTSYNNTMSPDAIATNNVARERLNFDKSQADRPVFNAEAGGFVVRPTAANPNGGILPVAGMPGKPLTESQGKAALFASRMDEADKILGSLAAKGVYNSGAIKRGTEGFLGALPIVGDSLGAAGAAATNWTQSDAQQKVEQAKRNFINAVLRQESGAAIGQGEFASAEKQYFPQPGDSDAVLAQKAANRQTAIKGMALQSGSGAEKLGVSAQASAQPMRKSAIKGQVLDGYRFKGGNPADQNSWEKI